MTISKTIRYESVKIVGNTTSTLRIREINLKGQTHYLGFSSRGDSWRLSKTPEGRFQIDPNVYGH
jgi:hypothetical protein